MKYKGFDIVYEQYTYRHWNYTGIYQKASEDSELRTAYGYAIYKDSAPKKMIVKTEEDAKKYLGQKREKVCYEHFEDKLLAKVYINQNLTPAALKKKAAYEKKQELAKTQIQQHKLKIAKLCKKYGVSSL